VCASRPRHWCPHPTKAQVINRIWYDTTYLEDQIVGQLDDGFLLTGFYEERWQDEPIGQYLPSFVATRAVKPCP